MFHISDGEVILVMFPTYAQIFCLSSITRNLTAIGCLKHGSTRALETLRIRRGNDRNKSTRVNKPFDPIIIIPYVKQSCMLAIHDVHVRLVAWPFPCLLLLLLPFLAINSA